MDIEQSLHNPSKASSLSFRNRSSITAEPIASCFYCLRHFSPEKIIEWADNRETAICPLCGIDSVLPGIYSKAWLQAAHEIAFGKIKRE